MGLARNGPGPHHPARTYAAPHQRTANRGAHRSHQPLLLQFERRARPSDAGFPGSSQECSAQAGPAGLSRHVPHGSDSGPRRRRNCRSGWSRSAPRAGRRSGLRLRHPAVRLLLSVPAWTRRHVPISRTPGPERSGSYRRHARRYTGLRELAHRRTRRAHGHLRRMGGAGVHQGIVRGSRNGLQLRSGGRPGLHGIAGSGRD